MAMTRIAFRRLSKGCFLHGRGTKSFGLVMVGLLLWLTTSCCSNSIHSEEVLVPRKVNLILGQIKADMPEGEVEKMLQRYYPTSKAEMSVWSGQTGYVNFKLTDRYSISVAEYNDPEDFEKRFVHADRTFYVLDHKIKERVDISFHQWDQKGKRTQTE